MQLSLMESCRIAQRAYRQVPKQKLMPRYMTGGLPKDKGRLARRHGGAAGKSSTT